jgi:hypothetical protein
MSVDPTMQVPTEVLTKILLIFTARPADASSTRVSAPKLPVGRPMAPPERLIRIEHCRLGKPLEPVFLRPAASQLSLRAVIDGLGQ